MESLVAAHERPWHLRHPDTENAGMPNGIALGWPAPDITTGD